MAHEWFLRSNIRPRHLNLLVTLDELRSVSRAADSLNITQSAVSKALAELEKGLDVKLFERSSRGMRPTIFGQSLIAHARSILSELAQAREDLRSLKTGTAGRLSIGVLPANAATFLPRALALLKSRAPDAIVAIREGTMDVLLADLRAGHLDLILGTLPDRHRGADLEETVLYEERSRLVCGRNNPIGKKRDISWADLRHLPWVLPPKGSLLRGPLEDIMQRNNVNMPTNYIEALSVSVIQSFLQASRSVACLANDIAQHYESTGTIVMLPIAMPQLVRPVGVTWMREHPLPPSAELFISSINSIIPSESG